MKANDVLVVWSIVLGFAGGIACAALTHTGFATDGFVVLLAVILIPLLRGSRRAGWMHSVSIILFFLVFFALGMLRMQLAARVGDATLDAHLWQRIELNGYVSAEPDVREKNILLTVDAHTIAVASSSVLVHARVLASVPNNTTAKYGDAVHIAGTLMLPQDFDTGDGRSFGYQSYLAKDNILYTLDLASAHTMSGWHGNVVVSVAIDVKQLFVRGLHAVLPEPESSLAAGITVGDKRSVGSDIFTAFQHDSLTHMLVLSGYNITIAAAAVMYVLATLPRVVQYCGGAFAALFFVLVSGGAASAARAALMALVALSARASYRLFDATRALLATIIILLLWNPWLLLFDPGFQLSALATFGLIFVSPLITARTAWITEKYGLREIVASTVGAQIAVFPLLLWQGGLLSLVALPANVATLAFVPLAMLLSFIAGVAGVIVGDAALPIALPAYGLLAYIIAAAQWFAALPFATLTVPSFPAWVLVVMYGVIIASAVIFARKPPHPVGTPPQEGN